MAKYRDPKVRVAKPYANVRRSLRSPSHPFQLRTKPFQIQPFLASPVLPGETLRNLVMMSRAVTKPINNPLIGWWYEAYFFYVRLRDIEFHLKEDKGEWLDHMVTDPGTFNPASLREAADAKFYHPAGGIPWMKYAMQTIVEYFFRDQGEDWDVATLDGLPLAQIQSRSWMDSLTLGMHKRVERDVDMDLNDDGNISVQESLDAMAHWQALRDAGLENLDYEDWIRTFGVSVPEVESSFNQYRPELIRYYKSWQYPTNTIDPSTGTPSSAVSWVNNLRADKDRMFKEPGFIIGLNVCKPKVFIKDQKGSLNAFMQTLPNWLPALNHDKYEAGFIQFGNTAGPLPSIFNDGATPTPAPEGYWVDLRDLLKYGDQFVNFAPDAAQSALSVVTASGGRRYATANDINGLFKGNDKWIDQDGVVNLNIAGRVKDSTPAGQYL